jgi:hypothetical protein
VEGNTVVGGITRFQRSNRIARTVVGSPSVNRGAHGKVAMVFEVVRHLAVKNRGGESVRLKIDVIKGKWMSRTGGFPRYLYALATKGRGTFIIALGTEAVCALPVRHKSQLPLSPPYA